MPFVARPGVAGTCAYMVHSAIMTAHAKGGARNLYTIFPFLGSVSTEDFRAAGV